MKQLKIFAVAVAMLFSSGASAATVNEISEEVITASREIKKFLKDFTFIIKDECTVNVVFSLNSERKIMVHKVTSRDTEVGNYLKESLEEKQILDPSLIPGVKYTLPVRLEIRD
ncbi:MAG TPA: hypothetical protein VK941_13660 [Gillisia sp.]|nr:hypothetical protein [Gillisia sp.]